MTRNPSEHLRLYNGWKGRRATLEAGWQENAYYCLPRRSFITRYHNIGDRLPDDLFDSTAPNSVDYAAAGIQGYLTNPATRWFKLMLKDRRMMEMAGAKAYLRDCEDAIYDALNGSNFYQEDTEGYRNLLVIATDVLYEDEDIETDIRFLSVPIENCVIVPNASGRIRTVYIMFEYTADQAVEKFGQAKMSKELMEAYTNLNFDKKWQFLYCVYQRPVFDASKKDKKNMPFASEWIDVKALTSVKEGGYNEFPFMISRWAKASGDDPYGVCPTDREISNIKTLNAMCATNLIAGEKMSDPPLDIPDEAFMRPLDFQAGGLNMRNTGYAGEKINQIYASGNVPFALEYEDARRRMIQQAYFNDLFIVLNQRIDATAEEIRARVAERMLLLGPAIGMIVTDKLRPAVERTYNILYRLRKLPPTPPGLQGQQFIVVATSPLAQAQKAVEMQGLNMAMNIVAQLMQIQPEIIDKVKCDDVLDFAADITNLNPKLIRDDAEVAEIRSNRAAANAMAQQMQMMEQGANTVKTASEADRNLATAGAGKGMA